MKIQAFQIGHCVNNINLNAQKIGRCLQGVSNPNITLSIFPELALTGYPPTDALFQKNASSRIKAKLLELASTYNQHSFIVGTAYYTDQKWHNAAVWLHQGNIKHTFYKQLLPNYNVFDEQRYFQSGDGRDCVFQIAGQKIGFLICEDMWFSEVNETLKRYEEDPVAKLKNHKLDLLINISASPYDHQKLAQRIELAQHVQKQVHCPILYLNTLGANDDLIFDGQSFYLENSKICTADAFEEDLISLELSSRNIKCNAPMKQIPDPMKPTAIAEIAKALQMGLKDYLGKTSSQDVVIGLSGGIDSAVVACLAKETLGSQHVKLCYMPSPYSSDISTQDAQKLADNLDIPLIQIPIKHLMAEFEQSLFQQFKGLEADVTEENIQSRIRGTLLMALSNKHGALVLNTGNKSEFAMGYCTQYGDLIGAISILGDLYKYQVYELAHYFNREKEVIPQRTISRPPSAELKDNQKDSDTLPDYEVLDDILLHHLEKKWDLSEFEKQETHPLDLVSKVLKQVKQNEYKRHQAPPILRISPLSFGRGRRMNLATGRDE